MPTPSPKESPSPPPPPGSGTNTAALIAADPALTGQVPEDDDSVYQDTVSTSTTSIGSTILQFRKLHGRTYHSYPDAEYWGPNDDTQNEGLDIAHHMMNLAFDNKLFLAPLQNPQVVLDVGTGTGIWAIDFADEFPSAEVIGTDLSPIQPPWVPPNCKFELDNCELAWTFPDDHFDYIHIRGLVGCIQDWPKLYAECLRCLKPGGWFEQQEYALPIASNKGSLPEDCVWHDWGAIFREAGNKTGRSFEVTDTWEGWMREAGFTGTINTDVAKLPIGGWPLDKKWKEVGIFNAASLEQGLEGFASYLCIQVLGWQPEEITVMLAKVRRAIKNPYYQAYYPVKTACVQKPTAS